MLRYAAQRRYEAVRFMVECLGFGTSRGLLASAPEYPYLNPWTLNPELKTLKAHKHIAKRLDV